VRITAWDRLDWAAAPLHARLTVVPGLSLEERALLADRLATLAGEAIGEVVLGAADLPGAVVSPGAPGLDEALHRARRRQADEAMLAVAGEGADVAITNAETAAAEAASALAVAASRVDQAAAAVAETNATTEWLRADRDALAGEPVPLRRPARVDLAAAAAEVEACRVRLAAVEDCRAEAPPELVEALESAHAELVEAEARGGLLGRRRLTELRAREAAAASAAGVPSYEAWLVRSSGMLPVRDEARIAQAAAALARAETAAVALQLRSEDRGLANRRAELARRQAAASESEARANAAARELAVVGADHTAATRALDDAQRLLDDARADRDAIAVLRTARVDQPAGPGQAVARIDVTQVEPAELEMSLLSRLVAHESAGRPLVVDDALTDLDPDRRAAAVDLLVWASEAVQIVYLEAEGAVAARVAELGPGVASVLDLHDALAQSVPITP
jgi:uncharacterized protein YhaN